MFSSFTEPFKCNSLYKHLWNILKLRQYTESTLTTAERVSESMFFVATGFRVILNGTSSLFISLFCVIISLWPIIYHLPYFLHLPHERSSIRSQTQKSRSMNKVTNMTQESTGLGSLWPGDPIQPGASLQTLQTPQCGGTEGSGGSLPLGKRNCSTRPYQCRSFSPYPSSKTRLR